MAKRDSSASAGSRPIVEIERLLKGLPERLLRSNARKVAAWKHPTAGVARLLKQDYVRSLRRQLSYRDVQVLVNQFERIFPRFNSHSLTMRSTRGLGEIASKLDFHLKAVPYRGSDGLALRGFYVTRAQGMLKRPLIFVNTAHHRLAVGASFIHELAHHVTNEALDLPSEPVHFFFDADYGAHLNDPCELAADVMVSLAGYPAEVARQIFPSSWDWGLVGHAEKLTEVAFEQVRAHLRKVYGLDLMDNVLAERRINYLAGMIHYAKLRWALLVEYDL